MGKAEEVRKNLTFLPVETSNVVAYTLNNHANGDSAGQLVVIFNANKNEVEQEIEDGTYRVICMNGEINLKGLGTMNGGCIKVPAQSALILYK